MESRAIRVAIKVGAVLVLAFLYIPLLIVVIYSFNNSVEPDMADLGPSRRGTTPSRGMTPMYATALAHLPDRRTLRDAPGALPRQPRRVRGAPVPVLRSQHRVVRAGPADRAPGDPDRHRTEHGDQQLRRSRSGYSRSSSGTRPSASSSCTTTSSRVCDGPAARQVEASMDLGADGWQTFRYVTLAGDPHRGHRGGASGIRALVRRDRRHELHVGYGAHDPEVHLQQPAPASEPAGGERRRGRRAPRDDRPGLHRATAWPAAEGRTAAGQRATLRSETGPGL